MAATSYICSLSKDLKYDQPTDTMENRMEDRLKNWKWNYHNDPEIPLLEIYSEETKILTWKYTYTPMYIIALFTIAKTWKKT